MTVSFRNIDASPSDPVATWPFEGLVIVLERGLVADWQPLITEVKHHPWGVTARRVESYLGYAAPAPVTRLFSLVLERARAAADATIIVTATDGSAARAVVDLDYLYYTACEAVARCEVQLNMARAYCVARWRRIPPV